MTPEELTPEQAAQVEELRRVLAAFAQCLEGCRELSLPVVDAFRAAGVDVPSYVPGAVFENLFTAQ